LLGHQCVLRLREHGFGLRQCKPEGAGRERRVLQAGKLVYDGRPVTTFNHHLYRHCDINTSAPAPDAAVEVRGPAECALDKIAQISVT